MTVQRALVATQRGEVGQEIRALEEWNNLLLEKAKRVEMYSYGQSKKLLKHFPIRDRSFLYGLRTSWSVNANDKSFPKNSENHVCSDSVSRVSNSSLGTRAAASA